MTGNLQPLDQKFPVVTKDGKPTEYFIRWAQQRQIDIGEGISAEQALQIIVDYLADHTLNAGSGIALSPSGNISDSPTIAAEVQAILDQITTVQGSVLFRGAAGWDDLAAGTSGHFLKTNGAGANPEWAAAGGGGGAGLALISSQTVTGVSAAILTFSAIAATYKDLILSLYGRGTTAAQGTTVFLRFNSDVGANYAYDRVNRFGNANGTAQTAIDIGALTAALGTAGNVSAIELVIPAYSNTTFRKAFIPQSAVRDTGTPIGQYGSGFWDSTAAINRIDLVCSAGNFAIGTIASLYGRG